MGITVVQKSDLSKPHPNPRLALVLAGGAISGGAFKVGGLLALDRFLRDFRVTDFDIYSGVSAGAFLATSLSSGIEAHELVSALRGSEGRLTKFSYSDFYQPNWREMVGRPARFMFDMTRAGPQIPLALLRMVPRRRADIWSRALAFMKRPELGTAEALLEPIIDDLARGPFRGMGGYIPSGIFDNRGIEQYIRHNLERNGMPNDFRQLKLKTGKSLYITAANLNTAQGTIFGHDEDHSVTVSEAVQASTAIPGFFRPARLGPPGAEQDFVDAAVRKTANISNVVRKGAQLIVCYNPFRPFTNYRFRPGAAGARSLADMGIGAVLNQAFRTMLHSRLRLGMDKLRLDPDFKGDCILIEPAETDSRFFDINPLAFWRRAESAAHGYQSVKSSIERHYEPLKTIFQAYGIEVDPNGLDEEFEALREARTPGEKLDIMEKSRPRTRNLKLVVGGR